MHSIASSFIRHLSSERDRLILWTPVLLGLGIGLYFLLPLEPPLWPSLIGFAAFAALAVFLPKARLISIALAIIACGFSAAAIRTHIVDSPALYGTMFMREVEGRIEDIQDKASGGEKLILTHVSIERLSLKETPQKISVSFRKASEGLQVGDRLKMRAMLFAPPTPSMPGGYDFARQSYYDRIGAVGFSPRPPQIIEHAPVNGFVEWLNALRRSLNDRIIAPMSHAAGPVAAAMMVGEMTAVSKDVADSMRDSGIYHVLSISGLHMSLAVALVYVTMRLLLTLYPPLAMRLPVKKISAVVGLISAFAYLLIAGYPVPAIRSFVMVACVMIAILFDRNGISLYSLAWSAVLILLFQPEALLGASFQLSYAATVCILAFYERYSHVLFGEGGLSRKFKLYFLGLMLTSLVASLATTPLIVYHFNRVTLWGILANMLMVPLASFWIMPAAVLSFLAMPFGLEATPLGWLDAGIRLMITGSNWFAQLPYAAVTAPQPTFFGIVLVVFGGLWLCIWHQRWRLWGVPLAVIGLATLMLHKPYDILVSDDAHTIAWRVEEDTLLFLRGKPTNYDGQQWLRGNGGQNALTLKQARGVADCDKSSCTFETHGKRIATARRKDSEGLCREGIDMVIAENWMDRKPECQNIRWLLDKSFLRRSGAVGIRFEGNEVELTTSESLRGKRPWNTHPRKDNSALYQSANPAMMPENTDDE